ncbi:hypothetical protein TSUD_92980 [Trifolium subterraneum]|uniref:DUF1685 domain-containing protein n=1 Tax=Trifolium subterraneum TaxID=3900 RepID=A0A2Z6N9V3_TRISU|nr:hypothetical protein TSUD_92980 [Trifolium subterraneum]
MSAEHVLTLLDSFWFETTILTNKNPSNFHSKIEQILPQDTKNLLLVPTPNLDVRFYSEQNLDITGCLFSDSPSPNSVLSSSKLRTIPSEREIREFSKEEDIININTKKKQNHGHSHRRRRRSRSLSELEFKELKGFMDLGFVFSEEDKDSKLVSLIPGLQRLGKEESKDDDEGKSGDDEEQKKKIDENVLSNHKPYLSEAWEVLDQRGRRNPLVNWRVPDKGSEIDMKDNLKFWAHTVASIVK